MIKAITLKEDWENTLNLIGVYDFYHTYEYHLLSKKEDEQPVLLTYTKEDTYIAFPLLIRSIPNTNYQDATSVYGYAGPIKSNLLNSIYLEDFRKCLLDYFNQEKIISVFSTLNPYITKQQEILSNMGNTDTLGSVVNIDLSKGLEISRSNYSKSTKSRVNKSRKQCYIKKVTSKEDINSFIDIYYENMIRLNAKEKYFFSRDYFFNFYQSQAFKTDIFLVYDNEEHIPIAGSMFVKTNNIIQFHLSGTKDNYLHIAPARVFLDEMRITGIEEGYKYFNLGGGVGGQEDSLFEFKSSFSKDYKKFSVWKYIVDQEIYNKLCTLNDIKASKETQHFFPLYRLS